ncbi:unnamed protein product [Urochloa decumbens]|uniref:Uncharacterized protein n=1 Tax=Urochloa decumbens TaxID=240449 RepID=A0ABC8X858_9POAL
MAAAHVACVPAVRLSSRLQLAISFIPPPSTTRRRRGGRSAAALTADVRVVIRRHFPVAVPRGAGGGSGVRIVQEVAEDMALRRRPAQELRAPGRVARSLAEDVLSRVAHPFDRGAVAAAGGEICARVAAACADPRVDAGGGVRVLVMVDTFARPVVPLRRSRPPPCKPVMMTWSGGAAGVKDVIARAEEPCTGLEPPAKEQTRHVGVIGDRRPSSPVEERFQGWLPW